MKIVLIGASGVIGAAVKSALEARHEVIPVTRSGDYRADIADSASIRALFERIGRFDAVICTAGAVQYAALPDLTEEAHEVGLRSKLMGQVNLVTYGLAHLNDGGSVTLTSGLTSEDPIREGASSSLVNGALEGFVRGAAIEMPRGIRINVVSPTLVTESVPDYAPWFPGTKPMPAAEVALGYVKSVEGRQTGQTYRMGWAPGLTP